MSTRASSRRVHPAGVVRVLSSFLAMLVIGASFANSSGAATSVQHAGTSNRGSSGVLKPRFTTTSPLYTTGELYGPTNPVAVCYTCEAVRTTGSAPPSTSLDAGTGVNSLTGDFSTTNSLFDAPGVGSSFSLALNYDAQLAQSELTAGTGSSSRFGVGWSSNFDASVTAQSVYPYGVTVNEGNGSQVSFTPGTGTHGWLCPTGDQSSSLSTTVSMSPASSYKWCALDSVQAALGDASGQDYVYQQDSTGNKQYFAWNGSLELNAVNGYNTGWGNVGETFFYFNVAPGSTAGFSGTQPCPTTAYQCTVIDSGDQTRNIVEVLNSSGQTTAIIDPSGVTYTLSYDSHNNLVSETSYANQSSPGTWHYVYDTAQSSPNSSDLIEIYDPDSGVGSSPPFSSGAAHSTAIVYNNSGANTGMASSITDGAGASTSYSYQDPCSTGQCLAANAPQQTTVTYPAQVPCPSCAAQSPVEVVSYVSGAESSTTLGSTTNSYQRETWQFNWSFGYGSSNSTETVTYPNSLNGSGTTASLTIDPAGEVISTTNALGDVATSSYIDSNNGSPIVPRLEWSFAGSSTNASNNPPAGAWVYTVNQYGQVVTATDPLGNVSNYGYYQTGYELCYVAPPTVAVSGYPPMCSNSPQAGPDSTTPVGSTAYKYDIYGDVTAKAVDYLDTAAGADPQTTTANYNVMGDALWSIPPAGQSGAQSSSNPYATVSTYSPANLPLTVSKPGMGTMTNTYDAALNLLTSQTPAATTTTVFDADNRPCYQLVGGAGSGLTCTSGAQAGSTKNTYVPGGTDVGTTTDANNLTTTSYYGDLAYPNAPTEVVDSASAMIQFSAYDDLGNACVSGDVSLASQQGTSTQCSAVSGDTVAGYNALGDETSVTDPSGNTTTNAYTNTSYPTLETSTTNALNKTTFYAYDADGHLVTTTNPDGTSVTAAYDRDGRVCTQSVSGAGYACGAGSGVVGVTNYAYNGASERTSVSVNTANHITADQLSIGETYSCALTTSLNVGCWGQPAIGSSALAAASLSGVTQVSVGRADTCVLIAGAVACSGDNQFGELGDGNTTTTSTSVPVTGLTGVTQISSGIFFECALLSAGTVECWGYNGFGQLGNGTTTNSSTPVAVTGLTGVTQISAGGNGSPCALLAAGTLECWGDNTYGQLGNGTTTSSTTPVAVTGLTGVKQVSTGQGLACAVLSGGTADCWGANGYGQLGNGTTTNSSTPVAVTGLTGVTQIGAGESDFACAATASNVECWGWDYYDQLSNSVGNTSTPLPVMTFSSTVATTAYTYANGQLSSTTDANGKTISYLYGYSGQVACETYPVSTTASCGTLSSPATGSSTNTIVKYGYDTAGRPNGVTDWLGNTVAYNYATAWTPYQPSSIAYPSSTGLSATYGVNNDGEVTSLTAGSSISDAWTYNNDAQVATTKINAATSATSTYNANRQITGAANLVTSTSNDTYTVAANGAITADAPPSGSTTYSTYNAGAELCNLATSSVACGSSPSTGTNFAYTTNGQRSVATPYTGGTAGTATNYAWNPYGQLCNMSPVAVPCGFVPANGTSYSYNSDGLRLSSTALTTTGSLTNINTTATTKDSTWDVVSGGSIPLNINDATTSSATPGTTTNTSYLYGNLHFGGTAPVEQITTTSSGATPVFLVANQTGVQGVYGSTGATLEMAIYSTYGKQTIASGTNVTPFSFQGSYTDSTGLIYLINRYYDPTTDQFLSIDPAVASTNQPFTFVNDNPLNATDPLGLKGWYCINGESHYYAGDQISKVGGGKCKTVVKPAPITPPMPSPVSEPSAPVKKAVVAYIGAVSRPWCYAGIAIAGIGLGGATEIGVWAARGVDAPPVWVTVVIVGGTGYAEYWAIKTAAGC